MQKEYEKLRYWLGLVRCGNLSLNERHGLLGRFPDLAEFFELTDKAREGLGLPSLEVNWRGVEADLSWVNAAKDHHIICFDEDRYPLQLKEIASAPLVLFVKGSVGVLLKPQLAMVGSRNPSPLGMENAYEFAKNLARAGWVITSGLALGIDAACHRGALAVKGKTIAVTATGPEKIYPVKNRDLAEEILEKEGAIITEFPTGTAPRPEFFPQRNRIISGLSQGVLVVEATLRSGSLITAKYGNEQGREVFAIPGSIHNPLSRGCHALIKQGAKLVEETEDILEELGWFAKMDSPPTRRMTRNSNTTLDETHQKLLECIGSEPVILDRLVERSNLDRQRLPPLLINLEIWGYIEKMTEGYVRVKL